MSVDGDIDGVWVDVVVDIENAVVVDIVMMMHNELLMVVVHVTRMRMMPVDLLLLWLLWWLLA